MTVKRRDLSPCNLHWLPADVRSQPVCRWDADCHMQTRIQDYAAQKNPDVRPWGPWLHMCGQILTNKWSNHKGGVNLVNVCDVYRCSQFAGSFWKLGQNSQSDTSFIWGCLPRLSPTTPNFSLETVLTGNNLKLGQSPCSTSLTR